MIPYVIRIYIAGIILQGIPPYAERHTGTACIQQWDKQPAGGEML